MRCRPSVGHGARSLRTFRAHAPPHDAAAQAGVGVKFDETVAVDAEPFHTKSLQRRCSMDVRSVLYFSP
jgi:hypothetical protein